MTGLHSEDAFRRCRMSATVHAQSRPIRLPNREKKGKINFDDIARGVAKKMLYNVVLLFNKRMAIVG